MRNLWEARVLCLWEAVWHPNRFIRPLTISEALRSEGHHRLNWVLFLNREQSLIVGVEAKRCSFWGKTIKTVVRMDGCGSLPEEKISYIDTGNWTYECLTGPEVKQRNTENRNTWHFSNAFGVRCCLLIKITALNFSSDYMGKNVLTKCFFAFWVTNLLRSLQNSSVRSCNRIRKMFSLVSKVRPCPCIPTRRDGGIYQVTNGDNVFNESTEPQKKVTKKFGKS